MRMVAVIGAGTMGSGIAHVCAVHGLSVRLVDEEEQALVRARDVIARNLERQLSRGTLSEADRDEALARITAGRPTPDSLTGCEIVIEAVPERREVKERVFRRMDAESDEHALLASNTSSISISWLGSLTNRPDRVVGMHFFNPVPVMKLVEVVRGEHTSEETVQRTMELAETLGKTPVVVNDAPGFVSNRVLMPMINEAAYCVMEGVGDAKAVDEVMRLGMAHPMGPLALADLIGLDVCVDILDVLERDLPERSHAPCPLLREMVNEGRLGRKSGAGFYDYDSADR